MKTTKKPHGSLRRRRMTKAAYLRKRHRAKRSRVKKVFQLYKRSFSLTKTGEALGLCKESIRHMLEYGHRVGVITFFGKVDDRRLAALLARVDRAELARDLDALTQDEVCVKYGIKDSLCYKLRKYAAAGKSLAEL